MRREVALAGLWYASGGTQSRLVDVGKGLREQGPKETAPAHLAAEVAVPDADHVCLLFDADETQYPCLPFEPHDEPSVARAVVQRIAAAFPTHRGTGEEAPHRPEKGLFVVR